MRILKAKTPWFRPGERLLTVKVTFMTTKQADVDTLMNLAGSGVSVQVAPANDEPAVAPPPVAVLGNSKEETQH